MSDVNEKAADISRTAATLWDFILLCMGSFTVKTIWNLSIKRMFPAAPYMFFLDSVGILILIYIVSRTASAGLMTEITRGFSAIFETTLENLREFLEDFELNNLKINVNKPENKPKKDSEPN